MFSSKGYLKSMFIQVFYCSTCLDLVTGYKLGFKVKVVRLVVVIISVLFGIYLLLLLLVIEEFNCKPHKWANIIGDWLPHLNYKSRFITYMVLASLIFVNTIFRSIILIQYLKGRRLKIDYVQFYCHNQSRCKFREEKCDYLINKYENKLATSMVLIERFQINKLYDSICLFWCKETFEFLDKYVRFAIISCFGGGIAVNSVSIAFFLSLNLQETRTESPQYWEAIENSSENSILFVDGLCQVRTSVARKVMFSIVIVIIIIDLATQACLLTMFCMVKVGAALLWISKLNYVLGNHLYELKYQLNNHSYREKLKPKSLLLKIVDSDVKITNLIADYFPKTTNKQTTGSLLPQELANIEDAQQYDHKLNFLENYFDNVKIGQKAERKEVDLKAEIIKNEVLAFIVSVIDSDEYVSIINLYAAMGPFFFMCVISFGWKKNSDVFLDQLVLACLLVAAILIITIALGISATFNSSATKLCRQISALISITPTNDKNHLFWQTIIKTWFTKNGLEFGYTIMGLFNVSWNHYLKVSDVRHLIVEISDKQIELTLNKIYLHRLCIGFQQLLFYSTDEPARDCNSRSQPARS